VETLISLLADKGMVMALQKGIPTLKHMVTNLYSRPDNVWCSKRLLGHILQCEVDSYLQPPCTNHLPIVTIIDIPQEHTSVQPSPNFREVDWEAFWERLKVHLEDVPLPARISTSEALQQAALNLTTVIQEMIQEKVKLNKPCPHSKRWRNGKLHQLRKRLNQLSRVCMKQRSVSNHPCHEKRKTVASDYREAIIKAKHQHWVDFLEEVADHDLWTANGYLKELTGDRGKTHIPTLKIRSEGGFTREVNTNEEKAEIFSNVFFPSKPAQTSVPEEYQYPVPMPNPPLISKAQLHQQIDRLSLYKASSPDSIPNIVLQKSADVLEDYLLNIIQTVRFLLSFLFPFVLLSSPVITL